MRDFINADCMSYLNNYPDKYFDLAIVDPPYGIGASRYTYELGKSQLAPHKAFGSLKGSGKLKNIALNQMSTEWDNKPPSQEYFDELFRVSKNQIIWGGTTLTYQLLEALYAGISNNLLKTFQGGKWLGHPLAHRLKYFTILMPAF